MSKINMIKHLQFYKRIYVNQKVLLDIIYTNEFTYYLISHYHIRLYSCVHRYAYQISITFMYLFKGTSIDIFQE